MTKASSLKDGIVHHYRQGTLVSRVRREFRPRILAPSPVSVGKTHSSSRLNSLASGMPACMTYLEVGVEYGTTFENVAVPFRWAVDPYPLFSPRRLPSGVRVSRQPSDDFFAGLADQVYFDLVFLDGFHEWQQTYRDLIGALRHTLSHSIIVIDDVVPDDELAALPDHQEALDRKRAAGIDDLRWQGDVFKVVVAIARAHPELDFHVVPGRFPQAIVWRKVGATLHASTALGEREAEEIGRLRYENVFVGPGIPNEFRPADEDTCIARAVQASRQAWAHAGR